MQMQILKNVMVPMRDGVRLATDVYLPARDDGDARTAALPAILARTSYDKNAIAWADPGVFVPRGYAVVPQDLRGRGQSEGTGQYFHCYQRHADIPGTYSGGWYDALAADTTQYFTAMARQNTTPQRLLMGPWTHHTMRLRDAPSVSGDVDFGPEARFGAARYDAERLRWFDRWLKGIENGVEAEPPVRVFVMGGGSGRRTADGHLDHGGRWRLAGEWPIATTQWTPYYLRAGGRLSPTPPNGADEPARFTFDPERPVPSLGAAVAGFYELAPLAPGIRPDAVPPRARMGCMVVDGPMHQQEQPGIPGCRPPYLPLATRPDVLVFQTEPLVEDVEVTGPAVVHLWIASSAADTDFTAKLIDVYPPNTDYPGGYHMNLVDSVIRCRYRAGWEREVLMTPGEVYQVRIQLPPTSNLFKAGHRIRLDISSSNYPRLEVNPNTGEPVGRHTHTVIAHNTVFVDRERPSHVVLPVLPG